MELCELKALEIELIDFYRKIIEYDVENNPMVLKSTVKKLRKAYSKNKRRNGTNVCFDCHAIKCAYIFQYCPCFTGAVAYHFHHLYKEMPSPLEKMLSKNTVTVCCVGGGPATEIVAISKVLEKNIPKKYTKNQPLTIDVIIIDIDQEWETTAEKVVMNLSTSVDSSILKFTFRFLQADLTKPLTDDVKDVLASSDFVTIVKVLSAFRGSQGEDRGLKMMQEIINCTRESSIFFFLDSSGFVDFEFFTGVIRSYDNMEEIYGTLKKTYKMSSQSRKYLNKSFKDHGLLYSTYLSTNKISVWHKK